MSMYPLAEMSDAEISSEIVRVNARLEAVEHTKRMLLRELESRAEWRDTYLPKRAVPQSEAVHLYDAMRNRALCGRKVSLGKIAFPPDGEATCSDCLASVAADVEVGRHDA